MHHTMPLAARHQRGCTLIETLMAASVLAVLTSASLPALKGLLTRSVANSQISNFTSDLRFARLQALGRGRQVTLCALAETLEQGEPACASQGQDWSAGWVVFVDGGERGQLDGADTVLRVHQRPAVAGAVTAAQRSISFQFTGFSVRANNTVRFSPPGAAAGDTAAPGTEVVCINKAGKARVVAAATCAG